MSSARALQEVAFFVVPAPAEDGLTAVNGPLPGSCRVVSQPEVIGEQRQDVAFAHQIAVEVRRLLEVLVVYLPDSGKEKVAQVPAQQEHASARNVPHAEKVELKKPREKRGFSMCCDRVRSP